MKKNNGITLIALIITIIVMLILVAVTINMAVNGGLFGYAANAARETEAARDEEKVLAQGIVGGKTIEDWVTGVSSLLPNTKIPEYGVYFRVLPGETIPTVYYTQIEDDEKTLICDLIYDMYELENPITFNDIQHGGEIPPEGIQTMDGYLYGDYFYVCNIYTDLGILEGWTAMALDKSKASYGEFLNSINGESLAHIAGTFMNCTLLTTLPTIPNSVLTVGLGAFGGCTSLENVKIPEHIVSLEASSFAACTSLENVIIPNSVTSIKEYAFAGCTSLTSITYKGTKSQWNSVELGTYWNMNSPISSIHCTDGDITL